MIGKFYTLDYIPHKLVYVYKVTDKNILFLAFFNREGNGMQAVKHSVSKKCKRDFSHLKKDYNPIPEVIEMINKALNLEDEKR